MNKNQVKTLHPLHTLLHKCGSACMFVRTCPSMTVRARRPSATPAFAHMCAMALSSSECLRWPCDSARSSSSFVSRNCFLGHITNASARVSLGSRGTTAVSLP